MLPSGDEVLGLAAAAEPELLQLHEHERREVVVEDRGLDVGGREARLVPQLAADEAHLGQARHLVVGAVVARHHLLVARRALAGGLDDGGLLRQVARPLGGGDDERHLRRRSPGSSRAGAAARRSSATPDAPRA